MSAGSTSRSGRCPATARALAMPAAWPMRQPVAMVRAEDSARRSAEKQRPATRQFSTPFTSSDRSGIVTVHPPLLLDCRLGTEAYHFPESLSRMVFTYRAGCARFLTHSPAEEMARVRTAVQTSREATLRGGDRSGVVLLAQLHEACSRW